MSRFRIAVLLLAPLLMAAAEPGRATRPGDPLYDAIAAADAGLFGAYNSCDLAKFGGYLARDVEFFHDHDGLATGRDTIIKAIRENICGKTIRRLVPGTLEVYPLDNYGAVEMGTHQFLNGGETTPSGEAKFVEIWKKTPDGWLLTKVISYDHHRIK